MIRRLPGEQIWILETDDTAYSVGVFDIDEEFAIEDADDRFSSLQDIVHIYWGPRLPRLEDYRQSVKLQTRSSFASTSPLWGLEYFPWNGKMYQEPSLKVSGPDESRDVRLK